MTQLYSVTINRKKVITKYLDPKGRKTETYEELISETYHDLPLATARGYMKLDPAAVIAVQGQQINRTESPKKSFHVSGANTTERYGNPAYRKAKQGDGGTVMKPAEKAPAPSGYADVVNQMMKDRA